MLCLRPNSSFFLLLSLSFFLFISSAFASSRVHHTLRSPGDFNGIFVEKEHGGVVHWNTKKSVAEKSAGNSFLILAETRTLRKDPLDGFNRYTGGWNISNEHYWASVGLTAAPFFIIAGVWFVLFGLTFFIICLCYCCCPREPYGYSRTAYALSLIFLILVTLSAIAGCIVLYTGQGKFHSSTTNTLDYVVNQADTIVENLRNVSGYLAAAKGIIVDSIFLPSEVQRSIDIIETKIQSSASTLSQKTSDNSKDIQDGLDSVRLALIIVAAVMLFLAFLGFLFSILGMQPLVYFLIMIGWILVTGTFILCGIFLLLHNVVADTCVAMDEWVQNPTAHTALDDILPCVDRATAQETLLQSKNVTYQLVIVVDVMINNISNVNFSPKAGPLYFNQSGPLIPVLCNPFHPDLSGRHCAPGEVQLRNAPKVWKDYTCQVSASGICATPGRLTPIFYSQMAAAVNVSYGLYRYAPFLIGLEDCTFARKTFRDISKDHCPGLRRYSEWIYIGLVIVSAAVMLSMIFWVIYARERRHRVYTKNLMARSLDEEDKAT
ncbi:uncharacterized protein LOC121244896 isoform X1 [Juglans microcarpa x Juglans regia]|uniref:uncharacterized protein LOC121244896 isoform X1 n=1 Tax=Juglans microcarpa x Juglans regia TaxID=2249226 RepID=UPI001B7E20EB|nr:uncharacterized protein LOC121244896 isoform X1 [Juglans microcarpa x Juglans regia]